MADIIQLLPDHVANQIAAGEVVQRPASVVKELLENAIDANATSIKLIVKDAGKTLIQVIDDGKGMSGTDARLSFERHATSKIKTAEDLFHLETKGFRGEALASIAAISHVELKTKRSNDELGHTIEIEGSEVKQQEIVVTPSGTSVAVKNLFFNIPARRKFLKSDTVELRHVTDEFHRVSLAHPNIGFQFYHNGSELFNLPSENLRQRIVRIFGSKTNEKLVPVSEETEVLQINGFVGKPQFSRKTRSEQFFFVNDRFVKSAYLNHAVNSAFEGLLKEGYHPSYFLNLTVDSERIDINIHPTKTEIKFDDEHTIYAILKSAIKHSLGQFNIAPVLDFERQEQFSTPYDYKNKTAQSPVIDVDRNFNPFKESGSSRQKEAFESRKRSTSANWESLYVEAKHKSSDDINTIEVKDYVIEGNLTTGSIFASNSVISQNTTIQLQQKYIISTLKSGLLMIDQNRAHQRILYEQFLKQLTQKEATSQQLLFPIQMQFSPAEMKHIMHLQSDLEHTGFVFDKVSSEGICISGIPVGVSEAQVSLILDQLLSDLEQDIPEANFSAIDLLAKSMARSLSIKNGQTLSSEEQDHLVNALFACKDPSITPNNKPTFITLSINDLEKRFT